MIRDLDLHPAITERSAEKLHRVPDELIEIDRLRRVDQATDPRQLQELFEEPRHLPRGVVNAPHIRAYPLRISGFEISLQEPQETADRHQRRAKIVRDGVGESLHLGVLALELGVLSF